ncbi:YicC/YloC family endoribonuclease [Agriterribacter humi]|uniref:YicC/YloC family endoribonuclease n=1 Tax=Agriterribacter humi TaxID=1104781 RepID=UPI00126537AB|nr:YicC/YloC family endoribonuclease [Agriterribacter humi]
MLKSMTGFGRAEQTIGKKTFLVEIKSLNGKQFEISLKLPSLLRPYEFDIRNMLSENLLRGSIDCLITLKQNGAAKPVVINTELAKSYYHSLAELAENLNLDTGSILSSLLKLPEVVVPSTEVLDEDDWKGFQQVMLSAIKNINDHRINEGAVLEKDLTQRINNIRDQQKKVIELEPLRQQKIREGLEKLLEENVGKDNFDSNRLEQEMIYYIEKIDISEEQVRLQNHCDYFQSLLKENGEAKGKKLSFILQEIGREINTTGAKAYDATIQKCVVLMKDELEKAKEQVLNVL